jgi:hypothetical protein
MTSPDNGSRLSLWSRDSLLSTGSIGSVGCLLSGLSWWSVMSWRAHTSVAGSGQQ